MKPVAAWRRLAYIWLLLGGAYFFIPLLATFISDC